MSCYHPLKGFPIGVTENGKTQYKVCGWDSACVIVPYNSNNPCEVLNFVPSFSVSGKVVRDFIPIPCGRCIGCRLSRSRDWAVRCSLESKYHSSSYFCTFTYDELNLPYNTYIDVDTGVIGYKSTLVKKHFQDFIKRLRRRYERDHDNKIRYYACGEYGTKTARPHYHAILFGLDIPDLKFYTTTPLGDTLYTSDWLSSIWKKGYVIIGECTFESCAYVARYVCKKQYGEAAEIYDKYNFEPEFNLMSLKPAIGKRWFDDHFDDVYPNDEIILPKGTCVKPPRYFDKCMDNIDEELMKELKDSRIEVADELREFKLQNTSASYSEMLQSSELNKLNSVKGLYRSL